MHSWQVAGFNIDIYIIFKLNNFSETSNMLFPTSNSFSLITTQMCEKLKSKILAYSDFALACY